MTAAGGHRPAEHVQSVAGTRQDVPLWSWAPHTIGASTRALTPRPAALCKGPVDWIHPAPQIRIAECYGR